MNQDLITWSWLFFFLNKREAQKDTSCLLQVYSNLLPCHQGGPQVYHLHGKKRITIRKKNNLNFLKSRYKFFSSDSKSTYPKVVHYCGFWLELFPLRHCWCCHPFSQLTQSIRNLVMWERYVIVPLNNEHKQVYKFNENNHGPYFL